MTSSPSAQRGLCSSSRAADHSIVWMAPCAQTFKPDDKVILFDPVGPEFFQSSDVPDRATTIVVSAQTVSRQFLEAWRKACPQEQEQKLTLVRRGTSLDSIDMDAAKQLGIDVVNTPGVNSPHVAKFVVETLGLTTPVVDRTAPKAVVIGAGSVGQSVVELMKGVGVEPIVVSRSPESPSLETALQGATHVAVCAATSSEPIITATHVRQLLLGEKRAIDICSVSRPEAFSLEAIMMIAQQKDQAQLYFDYGDAVLAPMREKVNQGGIKENVHWSSKAMASEACKRDMDEAVLRVLSTAS